MAGSYDSFGSVPKETALEKRGKREREKKRKKKVKRDVFAFAINVTLMVFESSVPHFLCPFFFFEKKTLSKV